MRGGWEGEGLGTPNLSESKTGISRNFSRLNLKFQKNVQDHINKRNRKHASMILFSCSSSFNRLKRARKKLGFETGSALSITG